MNIRNNRYSFLGLILLIFLLTTNYSFSWGQMNQGGLPYSFRYKLSSSSIPTLDIAQPDRTVIASEDKEALGKGAPFRYAVNLPVNIDVLKRGYREDLSNGDHLYRLTIHSPSAQALAAFFDDFYIPEGGLLYFYDRKGEQVIGCFSSWNNQVDNYFATELIRDDTFTLEYYEPWFLEGLTRLHIYEISYAYRGVTAKDYNGSRNYGDSGPCEVNVNCQEGNAWTDQKKAVVRIGIKIGAGSYWCTGTLVNNTNQDYKGYLLTADHCGSTASNTDLGQWVFYFNYESLDCQDPLQEPVAKTLTGATRLACSGGGGQIKNSDFYLVLLNNTVPESYNPYYSGWNMQNVSSSSGVSIHHPEGDIKKISTYITNLISTSWGSTPGSHWSVKWAQTQNGYGVTEPGSSGSPLFNAQKEIVGQLSGGESACNNTSADDFYGKFSYSWNPAGSDSSNSLHYWLDPANSGVVNLAGLAPNIVYVVANFTADQDTFIVGNKVNFYDLSSGNPNTWLWTFSGGEPSSSTDQNPGNITYLKAGVYPVSLVAKNNSTSDTLVKKSFITVLPHIFPVPFNDHVTVDFGCRIDEVPVIELFDALGRQVNFLSIEDNPGTRYQVYLKNNISGLMFLKVKTSTLQLSKKIMFIKTARP